ncbi:MAG TPA: serine/threonine-protein kinase [Polyangiaceae bacterium]
MEFAVDGFVVARRYALGRKIGSGGMGSVWLAHDQQLDRVCALKIVDPEKAANPEVRKRFLREARATAQIRSLHVVEVFEHGVWDGLPFIVMELLDGEELGARLERLGMLEPEAAYRIVAQIARGLSHAHALGIVHRDLKPENVFLVPRDGEEIVKVLDFGIAHHVIYSPRDKATQAGAVMGTPCYMSPEQALGEPTDWRADLWALGVLTFQCLTGKLPFFHDAIGGLLTQILYEPIPSIRQENPALPKAVEDFWHRAAERDPAKRFQNAAEMSDALAEALGVKERLAVPALVPGSEALHIDLGDIEDISTSGAEFAARMRSDAPVALATGDIVTQFRRKVRRRSAWRWGAAGALVSAVLVLGGWFHANFAHYLDDSARNAQGLLPPEAMTESVPKTRAAGVVVAPVTELPPSPPSAPATDAGAVSPDAGVSAATAAAETGPANTASGAIGRRRGSASGDVWPTLRQPDMPSLEQPPEAEPARERPPPPPKRRWRPLPATRDYGI